mgnify:FL=1
MAAVEPEGLVLTGGAADDTREQPCTEPHPHGVEQSQCKQKLERDPLGLTKEAQQVSCCCTCTRTPRLAPPIDRAARPPPPAPVAYCVHR